MQSWGRLIQTVDDTKESTADFKRCCILNSGWIATVQQKHAVHWMSEAFNYLL